MRPFRRATATPGNGLAHKYRRGEEKRPNTSKVVESYIGRMDNNQEPGANTRIGESRCYHEKGALHLEWNNMAAMEEDNAIGEGARERKLMQALGNFVKGGNSHPSTRKQTAKDRRHKRLSDFLAAGHYNEIPDIIDVLLQTSFRQLTNNKTQGGTEGETEECSAAYSCGEIPLIIALSQFMEGARDSDVSTLGWDGGSQHRRDGTIDLGDGISAIDIVSDPRAGNNEEVLEKCWFI